jgi:hypothetical protein
LRGPDRAIHRSASLLCTDLEAGQCVGTERCDQRDVDRVAAATPDDDPSNPRSVVPSVERVPTTVEIRLEPSSEVHRLVWRRDIDVRDVAKQDLRGAKLKGADLQGALCARVGSSIPAYKNGKPTRQPVNETLLPLPFTCRARGSGPGQVIG